MSNVKRKTRQRRAIEAILAASLRPLSPQEVLSAAERSCPGLGIATVYRAIKDLCDAGNVRVVQLPDKPPLYERTDLDHHHHFHCDRCGQVTPLQGCSLDHHYTLPEGFTATRHDIVFAGTCAACDSAQT